MQPQRSPIIAKIRTLLSETPIFRPTRFLYNRLLLLKARRNIRFDGLNAVFVTPTFKIIDDLETPTEKDLLRSFLGALHEGDTVWDVGANMGLYTLFAAKTVGDLGRVVAFEPEQNSRSLLERNVALNALKNVTILSCALDVEEATRTLYSSATVNPGSHSFVQRTDYRVRRKGTAVPTYRGDSLVREGKAALPNVVKIDVEGAEMNVLRGMNSVLHSTALRAILIEVHPLVLPLFGSGPDEVEAFVRSCGFKKISRTQRATEFHLFARRT